MDQTEREQALATIEATLSKPGGKQAVRFILNTLGSVPLVGGAIAGAGALHGECEQQEVNQSLLHWASLADSDIKNISATLGELLKKPTQASLSLLIGEIFGDNIAEKLLSIRGAEIPAILNPTTVADLEPYIERGWVSLRSTGSVCQMGSGNRVGNHVEELKRPYGLGSGFVLSIKVSDAAEAT